MSEDKFGRQQEASKKIGLKIDKCKTEFLEFEFRNEIGRDGRNRKCETRRLKVIWESRNVRGRIVREDRGNVEDSVRIVGGIRCGRTKWRAAIRVLRDKKKSSVKGSLIKALCGQRQYMTPECWASNKEEEIKMKVAET